jgi:glutathione S-transferase
VDVDTHLAEECQMKLYHMPGACSLADLIVLNWLDVPHEIVQMTLDTVKSPAYLAINPNGSVPMLLHGDWSLTENVAILGYLADTHPQAALAGDGSVRGRAEVMRWLAFLNSDVHKAFKPLFSPARFLDARDFDDELARHARHHIRAYLERIDAQLAGRDWLTGQRSIADPYLFVVLRWAAGKEVDLQGLDNLAAFTARLHADPGVRRALAADAA